MDGSSWLATGLQAELASDVHVHVHTWQWSKRTTDWSVVKWWGWGWAGHASLQSEFVVQEERFSLLTFDKREMGIPRKLFRVVLRLRTVARSSSSHVHARSTWCWCSRRPSSRTHTTVKMQLMACYMHAWMHHRLQWRRYRRLSAAAAAAAGPARRGLPRTLHIFLSVHACVLREGERDRPEPSQSSQTRAMHDSMHSCSVDREMAGRGVDRDRSIESTSWVAVHAVDWIDRSAW